MESKRLLPAWTYNEDRSLVSSLICSCCSAGLTLITTGSVLVVVFRRVQTESDFSMGGVAILVLGSILLGCGVTLGILTLCSRQKMPKMSSAAKADVGPDPFSLVPIYPSNSDHVQKALIPQGCQLLVLPGGVDPVYLSYPPTT